MTVLVVAWVLTLLSIFSLSFNHEARTELRLSRLAIEEVQARSLARSGLSMAEALARAAASQEVTALGEAWNANPTLRRVAIGPGYFSIGAVDGTEVTYGLLDEGRLLPLALATPEMLRRLPGLDERTIDILLRYSETAAGSGFPPLSSLLDLDPPTRTRLAGYVTPHPVGGVNINTASRAILEALGIPSRAVDGILARRFGRDGRVGTADDQPFTTLLSPDGGIEDLDLAAEEAAALSILAREEFLVTHSTVFRARSRGWVEGSRRYCELESVIQVTPEGLKILDWRERWKN